MWIRLLLLGFLCCTVALAAEQSDKADPIVGEWIFADKIPVTIKADGTAVAQNGLTAVWVYTKGETVERTYRFIWNKGLFIDTLQLSRDFSKITGHHQDGGKVHAFRKPDLPKYFGT